MGVGAFQPRMLKVDGLDAYNERQVFYRVKDPSTFAGKHLVIMGGGDSALDWALNFAQEGPNQANSVILIHRRDGFLAAPASVVAPADSRSALSTLPRPCSWSDHRFCTRPDDDSPCGACSALAAFS